MMRWLAIGVTVLALLWSGWWFIGSNGVSRGTQAAVAQAQARGWGIRWDDLSVVGFPNRFDTTITAPMITTPDGRWEWQTPFLQVFALSYRPNHVIAVVANEQAIEGPFGPVAITSEDFRASAMVAPTPSLGLQRATFAAKGAAVETEDGSVTLASGQFAIRQLDEDAKYEIALGIDGIGLPEQWLRGLRVGQDMPASISQVAADAVVTTTQPLDRHLKGRPDIIAIDLRSVSLNWGDIDATVSGQLVADDRGRADGDLQIELADLDATLAVLGDIIPERQLSLAQRFLGGFAIEGRPGAVRIELQVNGGVIGLGPIPLGVLPPLSVQGS